MEDKTYWLNCYHTADKLMLFQAMKEEYGDTTYEVVERAECGKMVKQWSELAKNCEDHSIQSLIKLLWEPLREKGFEFTVEEKKDGVQMICTKCPIYELAKKLNGTDWMLHHSCNTDPIIAESFNPNIGMRRTQTLMEGDSCCDHFYYYKDNNVKN